MIQQTAMLPSTTTTKRFQTFYKCWKDIMFWVWTKVKH